MTLSEYRTTLYPNYVLIPGDEAEVPEAQQEDEEDVQEADGQRENEAEEEALQEGPETFDSLVCSASPYLNTD